MSSGTAGSAAVVTYVEMVVSLPLSLEEFTAATETSFIKVHKYI